MHMYMYTHTHIYIYMYIFIHNHWWWLWYPVQASWRLRLTDLETYKHIFTYMYIFTCTHIYMYVSIECNWGQIDSSTWTHTFMHTHVHTYMYEYMWKHIDLLWLIWSPCLDVFKAFEYYLNKLMSIFHKICLENIHHFNSFLMNVCSSLSILVILIISGDKQFDIQHFIFS